MKGKRHEQARGSASAATTTAAATSTLMMLPLKPLLLKAQMNQSGLGRGIWLKSGVQESFW